MHHLARNFALQIVNHCIIDLFGPTLKYKNIYLGKLQDGEIVSIEEFITGVFRKYINNDDLICGEEPDPLVQKAACLTHYSYIESICNFFCQCLSLPSLKDQ